MRRLALVTAVAAAFVTGLPASVTARSAWDGCTRKPGELRFRAADGTRLVGHRFGRSRTVIVLAHENRGSLCDWASYGRRLAKLGFEAFAFDFRNFGQSQTRLYRPGHAQEVDVAAAVELVRRLGARKVFLVGASLGGSAVLTAAASIQPQVAGVVSVSGAADLDRAVDIVPRLHAPVLYLAGKYDTAFADDAHRLYDATGSSDKTVEIVPRGEHGTEPVGSSQGVRRLLEAFIRRH
jgi:dienelactone hydrolase